MKNINIIKLKKTFIFLCAFLTIFLMSGCKEKIKIEEAYPNNNVYYQVFVRSFADSDGDGIGDFKGIEAKLDYLKELGVTGLWLMPIHPAASYHGYDVLDYYEVNKDYGTMDDFEDLLNSAKEKGIKIIIDLVINHTARDHEWFKKALNNDLKYHNYYVFTKKMNNDIKLGSWGQNIWHKVGDEYFCGYFGDHMPDLNYENKEVRQEIYNIGRYWVEKGVSGFRIDAAQHLYGTNEYYETVYPYDPNIKFLSGFRDEMRKINPNFYITGEINLKAESIIAPYFEALDSPLDFPIAERIVQTATKTKSDAYVSVLKNIYNKYSTVDENFISAPFLRNHDEDRIATEYNGNIQKMKLAAEMLLTLPGSPIIYYGEEIGMFGSKSNGEKSNGVDVWDETRRLPINFGDNYTTTWFNDTNFNDVVRNKSVASVKEQLVDENSLLNTYKRILKVRDENIALKYGNSFEAYENNNYEIQGFYREISFGKSKQKVLVIHNISDVEVNISVKGKVIYISDINPNDYNKYNNITKFSPKSTIILDVTGE